jgi:hypothetical protein
MLRENCGSQRSGRPAFATGTIAAAGSYVTAKRFEQDFFDGILSEIETIFPI